MGDEPLKETVRKTAKETVDAARPQMLKEAVDAQRADIEAMKRRVKALMVHDDLCSVDISEDQLARDAETRANIMLAYRHLEDARMRLGKVLQAQAGGVSCYDA